jgi:hypothetical protein
VLLFKFAFFPLAQTSIFPVNQLVIFYRDPIEFYWEVQGPKIT